MNISVGCKRGIAALLAASLTLLAACGGSGDALPLASIGAAGGTVQGPNGAQVVVPPGALAADTPIAITQDATGAPALPGNFASFGPMFAFVPHGTVFAQPVTATVPFDASMVPAGATPVLYKTNAQGGWEAVPGATVGAGTVNGQVTSFSFFVVGSRPPLITLQPADASVVEPNVATFTVTALGTPPFTYRWERSDDDGRTFVDAGGRAARFSTPATTVMDDDADRYRVIVSNLEGSTESRVATLTVSAVAVAPSITTQPLDATVNVDDDVTFTVVASGTSPVYQWERSNDEGVTFSDIDDATNASLSLTNVEAGDNGALFRARISNSAGSVTSRAARLTVIGTPSGGRFTLTVTLSGNFGEVWGFGPNDRQVPSLQCINSPGGPNPCSEPYAAGSRVRLEPQTFTGNVEWTGCDQDNGNAGCIVDMNSDRSVTATFR